MNDVQKYNLPVETPLNSNLFEEEENDDEQTETTESETETTMPAEPAVPTPLPTPTPPPPPYNSPIHNVQNMSPLPPSPSQANPIDITTTKEYQNFIQNIEMQNLINPQPTAFESFLLLPNSFSRPSLHQKKNIREKTSAQ